VPALEFPVPETCTELLASGHPNENDMQLRQLCAIQKVRLLQPLGYRVCTVIDNRHLFRRQREKLVYDRIGVAGFNTNYAIGSPLYSSSLAVRIDSPQLSQKPANGSIMDRSALLISHETGST
jgi:hypothetical protein